MEMMMSEIIEQNPNPDDFSKDERPNNYEVSFRIKGEIIKTIKAPSADQARAQALEMIKDDYFDLEMYDFDEIDVISVRKSPTMFRVLRDGEKMQVSYLRPGDTPRAPDEHGF